MGRLVEHVVAVEKDRLVAGDKVRLIVADQIGGADGSRTETQMGDGDRAGFFGVVLKITLGKVVGLLADDLDGIFVGGDSAVSAQPIENTAGDALCRIGSEG